MRAASVKAESDHPMKVADRIRQWYRGTLLPPPYSGTGSGLVFIRPDRYQQPALAKALGVLGRFWLANWRWIITTAVAALAIILTRFR
jgi:hypothetical protein